jgi:Filamentation induced by cAMP protein Fic-like, C-terminal domain
MTPADLLTLNEGKTLEFKRDLSSPKGLLKTLLIAQFFLSGSRPHFLGSERPEQGVYVRLGSSNPERVHSRAQSEAQSDAILLALSDTPLSASELTQVLGLETKTGTFKRTIKILLDQGLIAYTLPDKPTSRLQKYRLTDKGKAALDTTGGRHEK